MTLLFLDLKLTCIVCIILYVNNVEEVMILVQRD
jgi:hypothetical protein